MPVKALIFDDDTMALNLLEMFLKVNDVEVSSHHNPTCPMYERGSPNCPLDKPEYQMIISDNNMPEMAGIDFFEDIDSKDCKISNNYKALVSGELTKDIRSRAKSLGITVFEKPCSFEVLGRWIDRTIYCNS